MKSSVILVFLALGVMVNGAWWVAAVNPLILSLGAILGAINSDVTETIELKNFLPFINRMPLDKPIKEQIDLEGKNGEWVYDTSDIDDGSWYVDENGEAQ